MTSAIERAARAVGDWVSRAPQTERVSYAGYEIASAAITAYLDPADEEMEERVARVLYAHENRAMDEWTWEQEGADPDMRRYWLASARAAIAALREMVTQAKE